MRQQTDMSETIADLEKKIEYLELERLRFRAERDELVKRLDALGYRLESALLDKRELKDERDDLRRLALAFVDARGRYHSQQAMCDLLEYFGKPCTRPESDA